MTALRCPYCNAQGLSHLAAKTVNHFSVIYCGQCGAIYGIVPALPKSSSSSKEGKRTIPQRTGSELSPVPESAPTLPSAYPAESGSILAEIGNADWSDKMPYSPEKLAARIRAAGLNRGTNYIRILTPSGPPDCHICKREMEQVTLPRKYLHGGRKVWICPNYRSCKQWEIVDEG